MRTSSRRRGFTLVEVAISTVLLAGVMGAVVMMTTRNHDAYRASTQQARVEQSLQRALIQIASALRNSSALSLAAQSGNFTNLGCGDFVFETDPVMNAGVFGFNALGRLAFELDAEADNGIDDDGDGLVDEGVVALYRDWGGANEQRIVLVKNVSELQAGEAANGADDNGNGMTDEPGFAASVVGDVVTLSLTVEEMSPAGGLVTRSAASSVRLRNTMGP